MDETMDMMGGNAAMGGIGSMVPPEQAAAMAAFQNTDRGSLVRDLNSAVNDVAPGAVQSIVAELRTMGFDAEDVNNWIEILDEMVQDPAEYVTSRQQLIQQGMDPEFLPEMYDYEYLIGLRMAFEALRDEVAMMPAMGAMPGMPVQNFAEGGIVGLRPIAQAMSQMGRNGDTMLAHITPQEANMLKRMGGSGTINPYTGLPEFFIKKVAKAVGGVFKGAAKAVGSAVKSVGKAVKSFASSSVGRIVTTIALTALAGPAASAILGPSAPAWAVTALSAGLGGMGASLLGGNSFKDSLKSGLTSAVVAGVGSAAYSGVTGTGVNAPYAGPKTYGELFGTAPQAPIGNDAFVQGGYDLETGAVLTPESVSATQGTITPTSVSATTPPPVAPVTPAPDLLGQGLRVPTSATSPVTDFSLTPGATPSNLLLQQSPTEAMITPTAYSSRIPMAPTAGVTAPAPVTQPGFFEQIGQGDFVGAAKTAYGKISPSGIEQAAVPGAEKAYFESLARTGGDKAVALKAYEAAMPGVISKYGPIAAVGTGIAALGGAFTVPPPPEPELVTGPDGFELYAADPEKYRPNVYAGQTPVTYQTLNPAYYGQQQYASYDPRFYTPQSRTTFTPVRAKEGGIMSTKKFKRKIGAINGPGTEKSDDIPAMLSDGEFVFTARAVRGMGNGSRRKGAKAMYRLMKMLEKKVEGRR